MIINIIRDLHLKFKTMRLHAMKVNELQPTGGNKTEQYFRQVKMI